MKKKVTKKLPRRVTKKVDREERGVSKIIILVGISLVLALGGGVYFLTQSSKLGIDIPLVKKPLNDKCSYNDPELCKFINNWENQQNYSVVTTSSFDGMQMESLTEMDGIDKFHMLSKQNGKEVSNMISIGDTTYTLDYTDNKWFKQTITAEEEKDAASEEMKKSVTLEDDTEVDTTKYTFIGKEPCANLTCLRYEIVTQETTDTNEFILFDNSEYLLRKMIIKDKTNGEMESVYTYGSVRISAPSPVKEGEPSSYSNPATSAETEKLMQQYQMNAPIEDTSSYDSSETSSDY